MKRIIALILALLCVVTALAACSGSGTKSDSSVDEVVASGKNKIQKKNDDSEKEERKADTKTDEKKGNLSSSFDNLSNVDYVMVYNPGIYDEQATINKKLSTGKLAKYIDTNVNRADGLEEEASFTSLSQLELLGELTGVKNTELTDNRAGGLVPTYKEGDKHKFYYNAGSVSVKPKGENFTCVKVGKKCYVWMLDADKSKASDAEKIAKEFDEKIYDKDVSLFGAPRFAEGSGKVNLLFHPMDSNIMGYFMPMDLFTSDEMAQLAKLYRDIDDKTANTDHAIVHINSSMLGKKDEQKSLLATIGHEFQHLINFSSSLAGGYDLNMMSTWLNESMSGYVEEQLYSGIQKKDCRYLMYEYSDKVRDGQSLYNFETSAKDAGVYGSVFLFSEYFNKQAGENKIFKKIHDAWRSRKTVTFDTAEAIYKSVPDSYKKTVDSLVSYPSKLKFATKEQEWMSKMALDFYLSLMKFEKTDPKVYENVHVERLLYDQINAAEIEGGGRIIFATKDGKFSIPSDADSNLVYVGFDKDFNRVTDIICK